MVGALCLWCHLNELRHNCLCETMAKSTAVLKYSSTKARTALGSVPTSHLQVLHYFVSPSFQNTLFSKVQGQDLGWYRMMQSFVIFTNSSVLKRDISVSQPSSCSTLSWGSSSSPWHPPAPLYHWLVGWLGLVSISWDGNRNSAALTATFQRKTL